MELSSLCPCLKPQGHSALYCDSPVSLGLHSIGSPSLGVSVARDHSPCSQLLSPLCSCVLGCFLALSSLYLHLHPFHSLPIPHSTRIAPFGVSQWVTSPCRYVAVISSQLSLHISPFATWLLCPLSRSKPPPHPRIPSQFSLSPSSSAGLLSVLPAA